MNENGNAAVLLNGAFKKHISEPPYRKSQRLVFLDIIKHASPAKYFLNADLFKIKPFTVIVFDQGKLFECRWTGAKKFCEELDLLKSHIWSSATLYDENARKKRVLWFEQWLTKKPFPDQKDVLLFNQFAVDGNKNTDLVMECGEFYHTVSISSIQLERGLRKIYYYDVETDEMFHLQAKISTAASFSE